MYIIYESSENRNFSHHTKTPPKEEGEYVWILYRSSYTLRALTRWEWEVYFLTSLDYEEFPQILVYSFRIQSDHSESDRTYSQETLASVSLTIKDPLRRVFYFGRFIPSLDLRLSTTKVLYTNLLKIKTFSHHTKTPPKEEGGNMFGFFIGFLYTMHAPCSSRRSKEFYSLTPFHLWKDTA